MKTVVGGKGIDLRCIEVGDRLVDKDDVEFKGVVAIDYGYAQQDEDRELVLCKNCNVCYTPLEIKMIKIIGEMEGDKGRICMFNCFCGSTLGVNEVDVGFEK